MTTLTGSDAAAELQRQIETLIPGREVPVRIRGDSTITIRVYPMPIAMLPVFSRQIGRAISRVMALDIQVPKDGPLQLTEQQTRDLIGTLVEVIASELLDLVDGCCQPRIKSLPHWAAPPAIMAWVLENFADEGSVRPWVLAIETVLEKLTGQPIPIWETLSNLWSSAAIRSVLSSKIADSIAGGNRSRTEAGASSNSDTGAADATGTKSGDAPPTPREPTSPPPA